MTIPTHESHHDTGVFNVCRGELWVTRGAREGESRTRRRGDDSTVYRRLVSVVWWGLRGSRHGEGAVPRHPPYRWHVLRKECGVIRYVCFSRDSSCALILGPRVLLVTSNDLVVQFLRVLQPRLSSRRFVLD